MKIKDTTYNWAENGTINALNETAQKKGNVPLALAKAGDVNFILNKLDGNLNSVYNEISNVLADAGLTPDGLSDDQLIKSIKRLSSKNIGEIVTSTIPLTDAGLHLLDGTLILAGGSYDAFYLYIKDIYDNGLYPDLFVSEADWQSIQADYGACGKYVFTEGESVRLPKITGFTEGTITPTDLGNLTEAGLPNITGGVVTFGANVQTAGGAFKVLAGGTGSQQGPGANNDLGFDASLSNNIYGRSSTVQPQAIKVLYYICVATSVKTDIVVDIDNITTELRNKADVDLSNITETAKNNILAFALPQIQTTDNTKVGYYMFWWNDSLATKTLPAGGTWLVWAHHAQKVSEFGGYGATTNYSGLVAGGSIYSTSCTVTAGFAIKIA